MPPSVSLRLFHQRLQLDDNDARNSRHGSRCDLRRPAKLAAGAAATTITITGSGFTSASFVQVGGVLESTTFGSATQLTALVPASQLTSGGMLSVIASSGSASSASGAAVNLEVDNPTAVITQTVPATLLAGTVSTTVALLGTGFVPPPSSRSAGPRGPRPTSVPPSST